MKKFEVTIMETTYGVMKIEAESQKDAKEKAYNLWVDGVFTCDSDTDMEVVGVEEP